MPVYLTGLSQACPDAKLLLNWPLRLCNLSPIPFPFRTKKLTRAVSREIPTGNSREFPEKSCSRKFPGIISGSREFSGIFYVLRRGNVINFTIFQMFFFWFRSSFTVEKNTIHAENHWNSSMNCIFLRIGVFLSFYKVSFKVPGNSREFPDWFREIPVPGNENLSGNRPP